MVAVQYHWVWSPVVIFARASGPSSQAIHCVRYRYDAEKKQRHTTIELIIETIAWTPRPKADAMAGGTGGCE